jgi:hypothetical protein
MWGENGHKESLKFLRNEAPVTAAMLRNKIKCTLCTKRWFYVQVISLYENYIIVNPLKYSGKYTCHIL